MNREEMWPTDRCVSTIDIPKIDRLLPAQKGRAKGIILLRPCPAGRSGLEIVTQCSSCKRFFAGHGILALQLTLCVPDQLGRYCPECRPAAWAAFLGEEVTA